MKSVFLAAFASLAAVLPAPLRAAEAPSAKPLLRVAVLSDIQGYPYAEDAGMRNLERALDVLAGFHPDVVVNAGDISDTGRDAAAVAYYKKRCDARLGPLPHIACMGNHELAFIPDELKAQRTVAAIRRDFNAVFGYPAGSRAVRRTIGGYDFVALSLSDCAGYTDDELAELKGLLDASVARDASKPIFVVTHYHPQNTVNDSASWWMGGGLRRLLDGYAQVVSLSGHTHAPLQDPRSIWQGGFTAIETSTLCYGCIFNDPPADFDAKAAYAVVDLDEKCRMQQVGEGWFASLDDVPKQAFSMTVPQIMSARAIVCTVPDSRKADAVAGAVDGPLTNMCPASILRQHPDCTMFLDPPSAAKLKEAE